MGVYRKNVGLLKATYKSNVKVGSILIESPGKFLANSYGLDAASLVNVRLGELPDAITDFIGGNASVTAMTVPPSVTDVKIVAAPVFPNLEKVYLGNTEGDATLKDGLDTAYANLTVDVYCEDGLVAGYQAKYASATNITFIGVSNLIAYEIPFIGNTSLTADYVRQVASDLGTLASAVEKIIVPSVFTDYSAGALDEIFAQFPNVETIESPWLSGRVGDYDYICIAPTHGIAMLTSEYLQTILADDAVAFSSISSIKKIKVGPFSEFSNISSTFTTLFPNQEEVEIYGGGTLNPDYLCKKSTIKKLTFHAYGSSQIARQFGGYNLSELKFIGPFSDYGFKMLSGNTVDLLTVENETAISGSEIWWTTVIQKCVFSASLLSLNARWFTWATYYKLFFMGDSVVSLTGYQYFNARTAIYVKAAVLVSYLNSSPWSTYADKMVGFLDYDGTNIPTFSGYTAQWYEDEDCTIPIATSAFVSGNRYFVKLTAI